MEIFFSAAFDLSEKEETTLGWICLRLGVLGSADSEIALSRTYPFSRYENKPEWIRELGKGV
jgi:hypothetical protein